MYKTTYIADPCKIGVLRGYKIELFIGLLRRVDLPVTEKYQHKNEFGV